MTTNHINRLDPALIRPGRVDLKLEIDWASKSQITRMFTRFYPEKPQTLATEFADRVIECGGKKSIAQLQGHFMMFKNDPEGAVQNVDKM
jgi:chaperone BCS1